MMAFHLSNAFDSVVLAIHEAEQLDTEEVPETVKQDAIRYHIETAARLAPASIGWMDESEAAHYITEAVNNDQTLSLLSINR